MSSSARCADRGPISPQLDAALGSGSAQSAEDGAECRTLAIHEMDDETLESAAILAAMTHQQSGDRAAWDRLVAINAERRRRRGVA